MLKNVRMSGVWENVRRNVEKHGSEKNLKKIHKNSIKMSEENVKKMLKGCAKNVFKKGALFNSFCFN